jgi:hypothetical protein
MQAELKLNFTFLVWEFIIPAECFEDKRAKYIIHLKLQSFVAS